MCNFLCKSEIECVKYIQEYVGFLIWSAVKEALYTDVK